MTAPRLAALLLSGILLVSACAPAAQPDYAAQHQPALDAWMAAWNEGNLDGLDAHVAADVQRYASAGQTVEGLEGVKNIMTELRTAYPDMHVTLDDSRFTEDASYHLWTFTGTHTGPGEMAPTGRSVRLEGATRVRYQNNMIVEERAYFDALDWMQQLGVAVMPAAAGAEPARN